MWCSFEDIEAELAIKKICNSHDASLELPFDFPVMSSVNGVADGNRPAPM